MRSVLWFGLAFGLVACSGATGGRVDLGARDLRPSGDADGGARDGGGDGSGLDGGGWDGGGGDGHALDGSGFDGGGDGSALDGSGFDGNGLDGGFDGGALDGSGFDGSALDGSGFDGGPADLLTTPDLGSRPPCLHGAGFAAFRFHYAQGSGTNAILDAFGLPDSSNWEAVPVYPTSYTDTNFGGGIELASGNWILIRYSVAGLSQINGATFSVYGRSYDVSASGSFDAWSPLYGDDFAPTDSMSVYPYAWKTIDFTGFVRVGDDPGLTGIRLYPGPSSNDLVVNTVELCIDGQ